MENEQKRKVTFWSLIVALGVILGIVSDSLNLFDWLRDNLTPSQNEMVTGTIPSVIPECDIAIDKEDFSSEDTMDSQIAPKHISFKQRWSERKIRYSETEGFKDRILFMFRYFPRWGLISLILALLIGCAGPFIEPLWDIGEKGTVLQWFISIAFWAISAFVIVNGVLMFLIEIG